MNYQQVYNNLIERGRNRVLEGYKESHHIVPRCLGGTDDTENLVFLTPEEHYVAHQLLIKIYPNNKSLLNAAMFMTANGMGRRSNKVYGWLKRRYSEYMQGSNNPNKNGKARRKYIEENGIPKVSKDYITEEWKSNISKRMLGSKNPIAGIKPWLHPRATDYTRTIWARADEIYNLWLDNNKPSYCKLHRFINGRMYDSESIGPFMNLVKYFRNGWIPNQDNEWNNFITCQNNNII